MTIQQLVHQPDSISNDAFAGAKPRTVASYERELTITRCTLNRLREALAQDEALLRHKDELIEQQQLLGKESDHRMMNGLQLIVSLLSLQSRATANAEVAAQLAAAANRVATVERVHRRLHNFDRAQVVAFKRCLEDLCRDFSAMLPSASQPQQLIAVEADEITLPAATAIPLGFVVNELITNAAKYGTGRITVGLKADAGKGCALWVANDGPVLPEGFDPGASGGLGMKIIRSFVHQIGGELQFDRADRNQGARFTVLFSPKLSDGE